MKKRYITLTESTEKFLKLYKKNCSLERGRDRAHALILSNKGYSIEQLSAIFEVRRATIGEWFDKWEKLGPIGLGDARKSGRPRVFNDSEQKKL
jgi:transposase